MEDELFVLDSETNPFYCLQHFLIKINFEISKLKSDDPSAIDDFAQFLHEYTHYLQTFTTINGISALLSYIDKLLHMIVDITIDIASEKYNSKTIIEGYKNDFRMFYNRLFWARNPKKFITNSKKPVFVVQIIFNPIIKAQTREIFIYNPIDNLFYHVSTTMLRENMAMMANFSIRGIGQDAIMDHVKIFPTKERPYSCKYWLIFCYFIYTYPVITNVVKFTYYFCELALMSINTGIFIEKLLSDIDYLIKHEQYTDENEFFDKLLRSQIDYITRDRNIISRLIANMKLSLSKIIKGNSFYLPINKILELAERGLEYKEKKGTIYQNVMDKRWIDEMSLIFLSPIILQPNNVFSMLFDDNDYQNLLSILFGVTIVSDKILNNKNIFICPFYSEIPICKLSDAKIEEICTTRPFDIIAFPSGGCLFYNTALILGLLKKDELEKYIEKSQ
jgi:hypothetical protein